MISDSYLTYDFIIIPVTPFCVHAPEEDGCHQNDGTHTTKQVHRGSRRPLIVSVTEKNNTQPIYNW